MSKKIAKKYPCENCGLLIVRKCPQVFCSIKCRLLKSIEVKDDCWIWKKKVSKDGYGCITIKDRTFRAHRVSFEIFKHVIPKEKLILHSCNISLCVNPDHLRIGTVQENANDTVKHNRQTKGEAVGTSKLTEQQVLEIRELGKSMSQQKIADLFGVNQTLIGFILRRVYWKHI